MSVKKYEDIDALLTALDARTNTIADIAAVAVTNEAAQIAEIKALKEQIEAGAPVTGDQLDALVARGEATLARLSSVEGALRPLGSNIDNPIPEPEPGEGGPVEEES